MNIFTHSLLMRKLNLIEVKGLIQHWCQKGYILSKCMKIYATVRLPRKQIN